MAEPIRHITIVGGGTAGWLTANMLATFFGVRKEPRPDDLRITVIESPNIPSVGVGEATVPSMSFTLQQTGISETDFFRDCNASFKMGVKFVNWNVDGDGKPRDFINPFNSGSYIAGHHPSAYYARFGAGPLSYVQTICPAEDMGAARKGPRPLGGKPFDRTMGYAYHLDAVLFAKLMQKHCTARGVAHVLDDVVDVERAENGDIAALNLKEKGRFPVEFVVDCTGFRGLVINGALEEPFVSYSEHLANDRAVAVQIPHPEPGSLEPLTRSTALGAGWSWRVPLYNRVGTGYVFSSAHRTDEQARDEFLAHLGESGKGAEPRVIPMRIGRTRRAWVNNCLAVGLSGGFIEPLESTAIYMIETAIRWLLLYFPDREIAPAVRDRYNELTATLYDEVRDFICLHYVLGNRTDDQYWIDARTELKVPDSLAANLELWETALPHDYHLKSHFLFGAPEYLAVILGKRAHEGKTYPATRHLSREAWRRYLQHHRGRVAEIVPRLPDQVTLLEELRGERRPQPAGPKPKVPDFAASMPTATVQLPGARTPIKPVVRAGARPDGDGGNLL